MPHFLNEIWQLNKTTEIININYMSNHIMEFPKANVMYKILRNIIFASALASFWTCNARQIFTFTCWLLMIE